MDLRRSRAKEKLKKQKGQFHGFEMIERGGEAHEQGEQGEREVV